MPVLPKPYSQEKLVLLIKKGDLAAFNILYDTYSAAIYSVISKSSSNKKINDDIFQKVFVKIWQNIRGFETEKCRLLAWMLSIARTVINEQLTEENLSKNSQIQSSVNNVNNSKEVLTLIYFNGYSLNKAAEVLNISIEELKTKLKSELDQLRK